MGSNIETNTIYQDIIDVGSKRKRRTYRFVGELYNGVDIVTPLAFVEMNVLCDFVNKYNDHVTIKLLFGAGTYNQHILPYADNLELILYMTSFGSDIDDENRIKKTQWRCVPLNRSNAPMDANSLLNMNPGALELASVNIYEFQLLDKAVETMRTIQVGGIYPSTNSESLMRVLMGGTSESVNMALEDKPKGVNIHTPDVGIVKNHIIVKHGTSLVDLPGYLQNEEGIGVYNQGVGAYYKNQYWYIWPLYNTKRFDKIPNNLTIANIPANKFNGISSTFNVMGEAVYVIATGETTSLDNTNWGQYNAGNGARVTKASAIGSNEGMGVTKGKVAVNRSQTNNEFILNQRKTGADYAPSAPVITDNTSRVITAQAVNQGLPIQLAWDNSDPTIIEPGMPVKFMYPKDDVVITRFGTVIALETHYRLEYDGLVNQSVVANSALTLFVDNTDFDSQYKG